MKKDKRALIGKSIQDFVKGIYKSTGQNEATPADGGNLVEHTLLADILKPNYMAGTLYSRCKIYNLGEGTSGKKIPIANEVSRTTAGIRGGVLAYKVDEGGTKTASMAGFDQLDLSLNTMAVVIPMTDEIVQDSEFLASYVSDASEDELKWEYDNNIIFGNGGVMTGVSGHKATGFSVISATITAAELKDIYDLYYGGIEGIWVVSKGLWNEITDLWDTATKTPGIPLTFTSEGPLLWGYPVKVLDCMESRSICLGDFSQYVIIQKDLKTATNKSLKFLEDEQYLRIQQRVNGSPYWAGAMTMQDGSVVHPFVMNSDYDYSSSSSSSSSEEHSESSSSSSSSELHSNSSESSSSSSSL